MNDKDDNKSENETTDIIINNSTMKDLIKKREKDDITKPRIDREQIPQKDLLKNPIDFDI